MTKTASLPQVLGIKKKKVPVRTSSKRKEKKKKSSRKQKASMNECRTDKKKRMRGGGELLKKLVGYDSGRVKSCSPPGAHCQKTPPTRKNERKKKIKNVPMVLVNWVPNPKEKEKKRMCGNCEEPGKVEAYVNVSTWAGTGGARGRRGRFQGSKTGGEIKKLERPRSATKRSRSPVSPRASRKRADRPKMKQGKGNARKGSVEARIYHGASMKQSKEGRASHALKNEKTKGSGRTRSVLQTSAVGRDQRGT